MYWAKVIKSDILCHLKLELYVKLIELNWLKYFDIFKKLN